MIETIGICNFCHKDIRKNQIYVSNLKEFNFPEFPIGKQMHEVCFRTSRPRNFTFDDDLKYEYEFPIRFFAENNNFIKK